MNRKTSRSLYMKPDYLPGTMYTLIQPEGMYHMNSDTELLGRFLKIRHKDTVLDIGTHTGALLMYAGLHQPAELCGIDLFPEVLAAAEENLNHAGMHAELTVSRVQDFRHDPFDVVLCNPPYYRTENPALRNQDPIRAAARHESFLPLADLFQEAARLTRDHGTFFLVHRSERLPELFRLAEKHHFHPSRMRLAYDHAGGRARTVLLELRRGTAPQLVIESPAWLDDRSSF